MPDLSTSLHLNMLRAHASLPYRLARAVRREFKPAGIYGLEWGDPETVPPLKFVRDRWVLPYVQPSQACVEIGPGGGRWTRYLVGFSKLYVVDYHDELLDELKKNFKNPNIIFVKNNGTDFPSVADHSVDFLFSFGVFVHLDVPLINEYLANMRRILRPAGNAVIQYSDKTKVMAREDAGLDSGFSENDPSRMRKMVTEAGFSVIEEDLTSLWHSSLIRFTPVPENR